MAKKKTKEKSTGKQKAVRPNVVWASGDVLEQPITATLDELYALRHVASSSRAPSRRSTASSPPPQAAVHHVQDGPAHGRPHQKRQHRGPDHAPEPHGDAAIYETMVRLAKGNEALLHPLWTPRATSARSIPATWPMPPAALHRGEARPHLRRAVPRHRLRYRGLCGQLRQLHQGAGAAADHLPNVLVSANQGIAVGMASQICGFNLAEVCATTIAYLKNPDTTISPPRCWHRIFRPAARSSMTARDA